VCGRRPVVRPGPVTAYAAFPVASALDDLLPLALAVAVSPVPVIAVLLMLTTEHGERHALGFLVGWFVAVAGLAGGVALSGLGSAKSDGPVVAAAQLVLGVLLLIGAAIAWVRRPRAGAPARTPAWLRVLDGLTLPRAAVLGVAVALINPKDAALTIDAGVHLGKEELALLPAVGALLVFAVVASITVAAPLVVARALGPRAEEPLARAHAQLARHGELAVAVTCLVVGLLLVAQGIAGS